MSLIKINNQIFCNLEDHLDMAGFDAMNDNICRALAKNRQHYKPAGTSQPNIYDKSKISVYKKRDDIIKENPELGPVEALFYSKLLGTVTLGTNFVLRGNIGYPATYSKKHMSQYTCKYEFDDQFKFLYDWIDAQGCFTEYGRVIFWINEPGQKTALHTDYPEKYYGINKDPFIWLTGVIPKQLVVLDTETNEKHYSNTRACVFDSNNVHASEGHPSHTAWSLRIDGAFNKEWAQRAGVAEHFNIQ